MYDKIPSELKNTPNWVCWKAIPDERSHSGVSKVPINAMTGENARSNDPATWCDFETAARESGKYSGIGFMFSQSEFFGVDIDDVDDPLITMAIKTYCKLHFGETDEYDNLKASYNEQKAQLQMSANYTNYASYNTVTYLDGVTNV